MSYIYFVVYKGFEQGHCIAEGNTEILASKLFDSIKDIRVLERMILAEVKINNSEVDAVVITWYSLLQEKSI